MHIVHYVMNDIHRAVQVVHRIINAVFGEGCHLSANLPSPTITNGAQGEITPTKAAFVHLFSPTHKDGENCDKACGGDWRTLRLSPRTAKPLNRGVGYSRPRDLAGATPQQGLVR